MPSATSGNPPRKRPARAAASRPIAYYTGESYAVDDSYGYLVRRLHASLQRPKSEPRRIVENQLCFETKTMAEGLLLVYYSKQPQ